MISSDEFSRRAVEILQGPGYGWIDEFIDADRARELRELADERFAAGEFHLGGIGAGEVNLEIRRDQIQWIERDDAPEPMRRILDLYRELLPAINATCYLGLKSVEPMLAIYTPGSFYRRHRDRFRRKAHRVVSLVLYLNEHWSPGDGGELVIYPESKVGADGEAVAAEPPLEDGAIVIEPPTEEQAVMVEPHPGRLVVFLSEIEHEVRVTKVPRYSMTAWLLDRPE